MTKAFTTAARTAADEEQDAPLEFTLDDETYYIFPPKDGQLALVMAGMSEYADDGEGVSTFINTFFALLDEDTKHALRRRLMDRQDEFGVEKMMEILMWAVEEGAGRPTKSSPASTASRATNGQRSTGGARRAGSTRSTSRSPVSAT
jgi:hypothetical protein